MNIYKCIKNIEIFDRVIFSKGMLIDADNLSAYYRAVPFLYIDFNNKEYFDKYIPTYNIGQWVRLDYESLYGYVTGFIPKTKTYIVYIEDYNQTREVCENQMHPVDLYYFINTKGQVHRAFTGRNEERDAFTKQTNNQFSTKEEAKKVLKELWEN